MKLTGERRVRKARIEIIPMIDVMLLLLVFYILSTIAMGHLEGIPVDLPQAATGEAAPTTDITVTISKEGSFFLNTQAIAPDGIKAALDGLAASVPGGMETLHKREVVINADLSVAHRLVVSAMDQLRDAGFTEFSISTDPK